MSNPSNNSRFIDMGGGNVAEMIATQVQLFYNPTTQQVRVIFNGAPYILMGSKFQRIGTDQEVFEQDLSGLMLLRLVPPGTFDPVTGLDLSQISMAGMVTVLKMGYDFFHNVSAGTPGYPLQETVNGAAPEYAPFAKTPETVTATE